MTRSGFHAYKSRSPADIEREALRFRRRLCVGTEPHLPVPAGVELFERLRGMYVTVRNERFPVDYDVEEMPKDTLGSTRFERDRFIVGIGPESYEGLSVGTAEARFVFAHELGHLRLHATELYDMYCSLKLARSMRRQTVGGYDEAESQADNFAGAFLVPAEGLEKMPALPDREMIHAIVHRFGVDQDLALRRWTLFRQWRSDLLRADSYAAPDDEWPPAP